MRCRTFFSPSLFGMLGGGAIKEDRGQAGQCRQAWQHRKRPGGGEKQAMEMETQMVVKTMMMGWC